MHAGSDAEFPAVAARQLGFEQVPLLCAQEIDKQGALPLACADHAHAYAPRGMRAGTCTSTRPAPCAPTSTPPSSHERRPADHPTRHLRRLSSNQTPTPEPMPADQTTSLRYASSLARVAPYPKAGGYRLPETVALMASNEGPEPLDPEVQAVVAEAAVGINRYPDPAASELREELSGLWGVPADQIGLGNGSCDLLIALGQTLLEPGAHLVYAWPAFSVYPMLAQLTGADETRVPLDGDTHDLGALLAAIRPETRLVIVCNPNNPTGTTLPPTSSPTSRAPSRATSAC